MPDATVARARTLRRRMTEPERKLWSKLRDRRLGGHEFLRQMPVGPYLADFCCRAARLIVELDGSGHAYDGRDMRRDAALGQAGYRVLRFWNPDVLTQVDAVCDTIMAALERGTESPELAG